jgi:nucleotidyltransferase substrate binding protein (TIGR01987 family)
VDEVIKRLKSLTKAVDKLSESIDRLDNELFADVYDSLRDSVIKRFEFTLELFWKCLKDYLSMKHGVEIASPKGIGREALEVKFFSNEELKIFLEMIYSRNLSTHTYEEEIVEVLARRIIDFEKFIREVKKRFVEEVEKDEV